MKKSELRSMIKEVLREELAKQKRLNESQEKPAYCFVWEFLDKYQKISPVYSSLDTAINKYKEILFKYFNEQLPTVETPNVWFAEIDSPSTHMFKLNKMASKSTLDQADLDYLDEIYDANEIHLWCGTLDLQDIYGEYADECDDPYLETEDVLGTPEFESYLKSRIDDCIPYPYNK
jgi:hypothetical protein